MPYVVFALKWRPQNFDEIVGQPNIVNTLNNSLQKNRLANAYLFAGPRGVGKTSTARILAKTLNCKNGPTVTPCGKCPSCLEITQGHSLDVIEIDGASNTGVDEIRQLRENVKFAPAAGRFKIYIIDEVHMLSQGAFNALLKTLEEPPEFVKFIFATTHPEKIPSTVISRCQRLDFRRIPLMDIIRQLEKIVAAENIKVDKDVLFAIAKSSDGSLRDAESILDQLVSFSKGQVSLQDVNSVFGLIEQDALFEITDTIVRKDSRSALILLNKIIDEGKDTGVFLANLIEHFRNLMVAKVSASDSDLIDLPQDMCERLLKQAEALGMDEIFIAFNTLVNARELSRRLESVRIPLEIALVKLTQGKKGTSVDMKPPAHDKKDSPPAETPKKEDEHPSGTGASGSVSLDEIKQGWHSIIEALGKIKMSVSTYLNEGSPIKLENNVLTIAFPRDYSLHKESLEAKDNRAIVEQAIAGLFPNVRLKLHFILTRESAVKSEPENPILKTALEMFGGRVVKEE
ncbi:MAG: DNA polymerase III subunit gamma/tau [Deltaproteobacteria bacterium]